MKSNILQKQYFIHTNDDYTERAWSLTEIKEITFSLTEIKETKKV